MRKRNTWREETWIKTTAGVKKKSMPWSQSPLHSSVSLSLSLFCLSRFFSSLCRSNGHGDGSESRGIRVRVSEGVSLSGYQEAGYIVLPPRPPTPGWVLLNYFLKKNSYRNMYLLSQVELELGGVK